MSEYVRESVAGVIFILEPTFCIVLLQSLWHIVNDRCFICGENVLSFSQYSSLGYFFFFFVFEFVCIILHFHLYLIYTLFVTLLLYFFFFFGISFFIVYIHPAHYLCWFICHNFQSAINNSYCFQHFTKTNSCYFL